MRRLFLLSALLTAVACSLDPNYSWDPDPLPLPDPAPTPQEVSTPVFAKGADISWWTEMDSKGYKFYNADGKETGCTSLMKELGCNALRFRVWVNPTDGWCNRKDVIKKAKLANSLGLAIMIDFHYSDSWADPGKQNPPAGWPSDVDGLAQKVAAHTTEVLQDLKDDGISVHWVQVGNETNTGMLWPAGEVTNANGGAPFVKLANAGYKAVKAVFPEAQVILHHSNAQDLGANKWFYDLVVKAGAQFDMIGLSLYPSYWDNAKKAYPDWKPYCQQAVSNFQTLYAAYKKPVMLVEFGMPASQVEASKNALQYVLDGVKAYDWFKGIFYWEPESEHTRNGYDYGCFSNGRSTGVLELLQ